MSDKLGIVGRKIGMTRIFTEDGVSVPVTVLDVSNNRVTMVKTVETDGYNAIQVAFGSKKPTRVSKPLAGHFAKAGVEAGSMLKEFHIEAEQIAEAQLEDGADALILQPVSAPYGLFENRFQK